MSRAHPLRILAIADTVHPSLLDADFPQNFPHFDILIAAGDIPLYALQSLAARVAQPVLFVLGNHVQGYLGSSAAGAAIALQSRLMTLQGLGLAGFSGCLLPPHERKRGTRQQRYSQAEYQQMARRLAWQLRLRQWRGLSGLDVLVTHAPPQGPNAGHDALHAGVKAFNRLHRRWRPALHIHGHVHLYGGALQQRHYRSPEGVTVVNAYGYVLLALAADGRVQLLSSSDRPHPTSAYTSITSVSSMHE